MGSHAIMGKAKRLRQEGNKRISWRGNCIKNEILVVDLNCSATAPKSKWEKSIETIKEGNWVL